MVSVRKCKHFRKYKKHHRVIHWQCLNTLKICAKMKAFVLLYTGKIGVHWKYTQCLLLIFKIRCFCNFSLRCYHRIPLLCWKWVRHKHMISLDFHLPICVHEKLGICLLTFPGARVVVVVVVVVVLVVVVVVVVAVASGHFSDNSSNSVWSDRRLALALFFWTASEIVDITNAKSNTLNVTTTLFCNTNAVKIVH